MKRPKLDDYLTRAEPDSPSPAWTGTQASSDENSQISPDEINVDQEESPPPAQPIFRETNEYHESFETIPLPPSSEGSLHFRNDIHKMQPRVPDPSIRRMKNFLDLVNIIHSSTDAESSGRSASGNDEDGDAILETSEDHHLPVIHRVPMPTSEPVQHLEEGNILAAYGPAKKRLLLFDYDGTLANIVGDPSKAVIPEMLLPWLQLLASQPKNNVWVISGRDQNFLQAQLGNLLDIGLVAEHGAFMRRPRSDVWIELAATADMSWKAKVKSAFEAFVSKTPGAFLEEKRVALVLHYRLAKHYRLADFQDVVAREAASCKERLVKELEQWPVEIVHGKCVIEARPKNVDKGHIVRRITNEVRNESGDPFILCIGDDFTDEGMSSS